MSQPGQSAQPSPEIGSAEIRNRTGNQSTGNQNTNIPNKNNTPNAPCNDNPDNANTHNSEPQEFLTGTKLRLVSTAFAIADIMVAIDGSILATALPAISSTFGSTNSIGWYGSAYLLGQMASQPIWGKVFTYFEPKKTYLVSLLIFCLGSVVCALAPNSASLIIGRAVTGFAASGLLAGSLSIFGLVVPLRQRPQGMALMVSISSVASMLGSTVGGVITDSSLTWRFCFWINVPLAIGCAVVVWFVLDQRHHPNHAVPLLQKLQKLDPVSFVLLSASLTCLFLGFEWGGISVAWSNPKAWGLILGFGLLAAGFVTLQSHRGEEAVINLRFMRQRTVAVCYIFSFFYGLAISTHQWLLPTYLQGVHYTSASMSGVICLAFSIPMTIFSLSTGFLTTRFGYYVPFIWLGSLLYVAGSVLLYGLESDTGPAQYVGYQILAGAGCGMAVQVTFIAVQVVVSPAEMAHACNMEVLFRQLGSSIAISLADNIFLSSVSTPFQSAVPGEAASVLSTGLESLVQMAKKLSSQEQMEIKDLLDRGITQAFILPLAATSAAALASWGIEWRKIKDDREAPQPEVVEMS